MELEMNKNLRDYLKEKGCFKLILGANNENYAEITKLVALYSAAGCRFFDLNASAEAIKAAKKGLEISGKKDCFLCVSVSTSNDQHLSKCKINSEICKKCNKCIDVCIQSAISKANDNISIEEKKCIGCGKCMNICSVNAISRYYQNVDWNTFLPDLMKDCDCIEFHISYDTTDETDKKWQYLCENFDGMLSICANRSTFSDKTLLSQFKKMVEKRGRNFVIIQADGEPMTGGENDYNTTLQAIATADIVTKSKICDYVIISGGTNSNTGKLADLCRVDVSGIAIGSYARKIVKKYTDCEDFLSNKEKFDEALSIAKDLIASTK